MPSGASRIFLLLVVLVMVTFSLVVPPAHAFTDEPPVAPQYQATPVPLPTPDRAGPPWLGVLVVFVAPLIYMLIRSRGKKMPDLQPPGAEVPVFGDDDRPFRPYDDEDEDEVQTRRKA